MDRKRYINTEVSGCEVVHLGGLILASVLTLSNLEVCGQDGSSLIN